MVALVVAVVQLGSSGLGPLTPGASATPTTAGESGPGPVGEPPVIEKGPSLGEAWTTAPDPATFITVEDETSVASDQYLVVFEDGTQADRAEAAATAIGGTIVGRIAYLDTWKIGVSATVDVEAWRARKAILEGQPGVTAVAAVSIVTTDAAPDCAPALGDAVYAGTNAKPYEMIGVKAAWEAYYASGLPKSSVHLGMTDTALTRGDAGKKLNWEFDDITFNGDPATTSTLRPATKKDPRTDGFHHSDGTLGIIAADASDGGIAGIASPLGANLLVSFSELNAATDKGAAQEWKAADGSTYTDAALLSTMRQIEAGATIINGSWGGSTTSAAQAGNSAMWKKFYTKMAKDHPKVLFVFSAGNNNQALDGTNHWPGGIPSPNVISVGNIDTDGTRNSTSNGIDPTVSGGEVSLGAPGNQAVWGKGADGKVRAEYGGTSSAAPMVAATAILVRAIDPTLTAVQIKDLITGSADSGQAQVGGRTLRADLAVRKAIDGVRARAKLPPLTDKMIADGKMSCSVTVTGSILRRLESPAGATEWSVKGSLTTAPVPTALSLVIGGGRPSDWRQAVSGPGVIVSWKALAPKVGVVIIVTRLDNGFWVKFTLRDDGRPTASPTPAPTPTPTPAEGDVDCSGPPAGVRPGTIAYVKWSLHCGAISP